MGVLEPGNLTEDQVALVLRRAAELDTTTAIVDEGLPVAAVEAAAAEVGLPPEAVRQAVAELRAGMLDDRLPELGPDVIVVARVVPCDVEHALAATGVFLGTQAIHRVRDRADQQVWRRRDDFLAKTFRFVDLTGRIRLGSVEQVEVRAVPVEGGTLLRLTARLTWPARFAPRLAATAGAIAGVAGTGVALAIGDVGAAAIVAGTGTVAGSGGWALARIAVQRERRRVTEALEGFLDECELGRLPESRSMIDKLRRQARAVRPTNWV